MGKWKTRTRGFRRKHEISDFKVKSGMFIAPRDVSDKMDGGEGSHSTFDI